VDVEGAAHLLDLVGADRAAASVAPSASSAKRDALRTLTRLRALERAAAGGDRRGLRAIVVEGLSEEAAARMAATDAERFLSTGLEAGLSTGLEAGLSTSLLSTSLETDPDALDLRPTPAPAQGPAREPVRPRAGGTPSDVRVRHRVASDDRPPVSDLLTDFESACSDAAVVEYVVDPWPRRRVRAAP
jgi:hypothetical protein